MTQNASNIEVQFHKIGSDPDPTENQKSPRVNTWHISDADKFAKSRVKTAIWLAGSASDRISLER